MKNQILEEAKQELVNGHSKKRHAFRYFVLATNENGKPRQRTVVLRKTLADLSLVIYTDKRTQKVKDIQDNAEFSALFYDSKKLLQIRVEGKAELITDKEQIATYWHTVQAESRKDYTTSIAPGTPIKNPDEVGYKAEENYFCPVKLIPNTIEYLRLKRPNHIRVLFTRMDTDWSGEFLVP
ncbi:MULTISPECIES: pyridoxamine 5'-phosphate oxidase family protein [unclassified Polaribacter]|uniref:pyridoxamine 5'-phosphate oxidase family protein n=1 Tax=unclassified Polaribacter TaxID=196858 RepID=UPI0011BD623B|nr:MULTISPECIES: pyridoxamine 5'-phosphate oxidase family protein [unclassified Polaribacter]TXD50751.1 pyridoxamine 5'-phosphate oxidase [Polaribacter sp. IC063]TXD57416.1 pyridoxamine 5'-phosphate oxidase [Polaribacter sp. IC066]